MIRTVLIPDSHLVTLLVPDNYIGEVVEIPVFAGDVTFPVKKYPEYMQHKQQIDNKLTIINPYFVSH
jgi:hypothetical protein